VSYIIAHRYSKAFFDLAVDEKIEDVIIKDVKYLKESLAQSKDLKSFITKPLSSKECAICVNALFKKSLHELTVRFLLFLHKKGRLNLLSEICCDVEKVYKEKVGILDVNIETSFDLTDKTIKEIDKHLSKKFTKTVQSRISTNKKLIGGMRLIFDNRIYDFSLLNQLKQFKQKLIST
jgi:F-type H+-transporting ATPase subunit delta